MNSKLPVRPESPATGTTGATPAPVLPVVKFPAAARNSDAQRRMISKQAASGTANHARHHVSRQTQS